MSKLNYRHIIKMIDYANHEKAQWMVLEYADKGDLEDYIRSVRKAGITEDMNEDEKDELLD